MKKAELIEESLYNWFLAFSAEASKASHRGFPTKKDLSDYTLRDRIITTFLIGTQLIKELQTILNPPKPVKLVPHGKFKMKIIKSKPITPNDVFHETLDGI